MKRITINRSETSIDITIPNELLVFAANNHPDGIAVKEENLFLNKVVDLLTTELGESESGLSGLEHLLDNAIEECAINEDGLEYTEL